MSRNGAGIYSKPPGSTITLNAVSSSSQINTLADDIAADLNIARPIVAGGTGATTATAARTALAVPGSAVTETISGAWTYSAAVAFAAGTAALPGQAVSGDPDTGTLSPAANTLAWATAGQEAMRLTTAQTLRVSSQLGGTAGFPAGVSGSLQLQGLAGVAGAGIHRASADSIGPFVIFSKSRGIVSADTTIVLAGDTAGRINFQGADGAASLIAAYILSSVTGTPAVNDVRANIRIFVGTAATPAETFTFDTDGSAKATHGTGGLGYSSLAIGNGTQITSKATGVMVNKLAGQITTSNAALAAAATVGFTVTNSTILATDIVTVAVQSPGGFKYRASCTAVSAGSFEIVLNNITAGSLSEAVVINFAVIRAN